MYVCFSIAPRDLFLKTQCIFYAWKPISYNFFNLRYYLLLWVELSQKISNGRGLVLEHQFLFNKTTLFCVSPISDVGLEKLLSLAVKEDLIARNGKFVGYGFSRCEPKQEQVSASSFLKAQYFLFCCCQKLLILICELHTLFWYNDY